MMEAVRTSETSVNNQFTRQYNPEDSSEHHCFISVQYKAHLEDETVYSIVLSWQTQREDHF
jgi:hypothetical protein